MTFPTDEPGRRRAVAEALLRITAREGLDAVTVRAVAAEAGTSLRMVQRQFETKEEMLLFAVSQIVEMTTERLQRIATDPPMLGTLRRLLMELLPLDEQRTAEARVYLAFAARATVRPEFAELLADLAQLEDVVVEILEDAQTRGELARGLELRALARMLTALTDGITLALLNRPPGTPPDAVLAGFDAALELIARAPAPPAA